MKNKNSALEEIRNKYFPDEDIKSLEKLLRFDGEDDLRAKNGMEIVYESFEELMYIAKISASKDERLKLENTLSAMYFIKDGSKVIYQLVLDTLEEVEEDKRQGFIGVRKVIYALYDTFFPNTELPTNHEVEMIKKHFSNMDNIINETFDNVLTEYRGSSKVFYRTKLKELRKGEMKDGYGDYIREDFLKEYKEKDKDFKAIPKFVEKIR